MPPIDDVHVVPHDVSCRLSCGEVTMSTTIVAPLETRREGPVPVVFAFPGGGYSKNYFDMRPPGAGDYSMARYLARRGIVVVACDNLATGGSTRPSPASSLRLDDMVEGNQAVVDRLLGSLRTGKIAGLRPLPAAVPIGLGHSMGAGLVTVQQARHQAYAGVVLLGRALSGSPIPAPSRQGRTEPRWLPGTAQLADFEAAAEIVDGYYMHHHHTRWQRYLFFWDDVSTELIEYDERMGTVFPLHIARELSAPGGPNQQGAELVSIPVLLAFGERDVTQDPLAEALKYRACTDIRVLTVPRSAHCHNMSAMRRWLWERVAKWSHEVVGQAPS